MVELIGQHIVDRIAGQYGAAVATALEHFESQQADEDRLTGALGQSMAMTVHGRAVGTDGHEYAWKTELKSTRGRGRRASEKRLGADAFLEVVIRDELGVQLRRKTLPIQAKKRWTATDRTLARQVEKMLAACGSCLVVDYQDVGYSAVSGPLVLEADGDRRRIPTGALQPLADILGKEFLSCHIGTTKFWFDVRAQELVPSETPAQRIPLSAARLISTTISRVGSNQEHRVQ